MQWLELRRLRRSSLNSRKSLMTTNALTMKPKLISAKLKAIYREVKPLKRKRMEVSLSSKLQSKS